MTDHKIIMKKFHTIRQKINKLPFNNLRNMYTIEYTDILLEYSENKNYEVTKNKLEYLLNFIEN